MKYPVALLVAAFHCAPANAASTAEEPPTTNAKLASVASRATAQASVRIVDMVRVENGQGSGTGPQLRQVKRKIACTTEPDNGDKLCDETIFEVE